MISGNALECSLVEQEGSRGNFCDPRSNAKRKEYFLCLDNRPLVNLYDMSMSPEDLLMEQDSYYNELRRLMDSNPNDNYDERYELLKFTGTMNSGA